MHVTIKMATYAWVHSLLVHLQGKGQIIDITESMDLGLPLSQDDALEDDHHTKITYTTPSARNPRACLLHIFQMEYIYSVYVHLFANFNLKRTVQVMITLMIESKYGSTYEMHIK